MVVHRSPQVEGQEDQVARRSGAAGEQKLQHTSACLSSVQQQRRQVRLQDRRGHGGERSRHIAAFAFAAGPEASREISPQKKVSVDGAQLQRASEKDN